MRTLSFSRSEAELLIDILWDTPSHEADEIRSRLSMEYRYGMTPEEIEIVRKLDEQASYTIYYSYVQPSSWYPDYRWK